MEKHATQEDTLIIAFGIDWQQKLNGDWAKSKNEQTWKVLTKWNMGGRALKDIRQKQACVQLWSLYACSINSCTPGPFIDSQ